MQPVSYSKTTSKNIKIKYIVLTVLAFLGVVFLGIAVWLMVALNTPKDPSEPKEAAFTVKANSGIEVIADNLVKANLISDRNLFILYAKFGPSRGNLQPGIYLFSPAMSLSKITDTMGEGRVSTRKVTFQEGLNINEMAAKWAKAGLGDAQSFVVATKPPNTYSQEFLRYRSNKDSLEGYLFPATYEILVTTTPQQQINDMLDAFAAQVLPKLPSEVANTTKLNEVVTLASIVEKEANTAEDRRLVAGVFYNRLRLGMKLESDVTINYVTGKTATQAADLKIDSPYNSYLYKGLPPTPICSPGLDAILATVSPTQSEYLFFLADKTGKVHYAKNLTEHEQNIDKYLN